jgi:hypothetical protein
LLDSTIVTVIDQPAEALKTIYYYNLDLSYNNIVVQKRNKDGVWENSTKSAWLYRDAKIQSLRNYTWSTTRLLWLSVSKLEYVYNNILQPTEEIFWLRKNDSWEQSLRYFYEYDLESKLSKKLVSIPLYRDWRNINTVNYIPSADKKTLNIESVYGFWGGNTGGKLLSDISFPFNDQIVIHKAHTVELNYVPFNENANSIISATASLLKVYPNPSHGVFFISNFDAVNCSWSVTSLSGVRIKHSTHNFVSSTVNISELPNGVYLLIISSPTTKQTRKLVKF